ncbi:MAG TPA: hypothetical protein DHM37_08655 [Candidatus Cloacimonas sp.]|jgi:hypothetical protein|nr:hypothetical protein [Candidatus Cloacimonadota bacterium]HCX73774.1 hypothetical protein [Candidatus Cloacimonas sp.]
MKTTLQIIDSCPKFPYRISSEQADLLKRDFVLDVEQIQRQNNPKTLLYKYFYQYNSENYMLLEEFLFRDNETLLDIKRAIGRNYYLYKLE